MARPSPKNRPFASDRPPPVPEVISRIIIYFYFPLFVI